MKKIIFISILIYCYINTYTQDTLKILHYNLMRYGLNDAGCDQQNNNIITKTQNISKIINYLKPDIFTVNEICDTSFYHTFLLYNSFNLNGLNHYTLGPVLGNYLTSQIFYNTKKIELKKIDIIPTQIDNTTRNSYAYLFYYKSNNLIYGDTIFFKIILTHLKAGQEYSNIRGQQAEIIMNYLINNTTTNYFVIGDMNLYTNTEDAYQVFTNNYPTNIRLYDPGPSGQWHDNPNFTIYHTQSTFVGNSSCFADGGLDDRFDFILYSYSIKNFLNKIKYIDNSFKTIGQDGNRLNQSIDYGVNLSEPIEIINALKTSDHLPVFLKIFINATPQTTINDNNFFLFKLNNKIIHIDKSFDTNLPSEISIYNINGIKLYQNSHLLMNDELFLNTENKLLIITIQQNSKKSIIKFCNF